MRYAFFRIAAFVVMLGVAATAARAQQTGGAVFAFGLNDHGQLGNGLVDSSLNPLTTFVPNAGGLSDAIAVAAGAEHSLVLRADGTVWAWGDNTYGQLGDGTHNASATPVAVVGLSHVASIAAGPDYSLAVSNGFVYAWGDNSHGQLGADPNHSPSAQSPVLVPGVYDVTSVAAGKFHVLALRINGTVWSWGTNDQGQLGDGTFTARFMPNPLALLNIIGIAAGHYHSVALRADGTVYTWGDNCAGQLAFSGTVSPYPVPASTSTLSNVRTVSANGWHSVALKADGTVWEWGSYPAPSQQVCSTSAYVRTFSNVSDVTAVTAGEFNTTVLKSDGTVWQWGGALWSPTRVDRAHGVTNIAGGVFTSSELVHSIRSRT